MPSAKTDLKSLLKDPSLLETRAYVNGQWIDGDDGTFDVTNPARGDVIAQVADLSRAQVGKAIDAAESAQKEWASWTGKERAAVLRKWFDLMMENQDDLGTILTAEQGKPLAEAKGEIAYGASFIEFFGEEAKRNYGETIPGHQRDKRITVIKQPIGVAASITPWNFPNAMITRKAGPALAAGCAFVARPAAETPLSAIVMGVLAERAGIPAGVFNVVPSSSSSAVGKEFCENPKVRKLTFTGSTEVGRILLKQASEQVMKCSMELGGNAPFIVFDDADLDAAVEGAIMCKFRNNGQTCVCANRIYVQAGVYDAFAQKLKDRVSKMKVGDGLEAGVDLGPLINPEAGDKVIEHIKDAKSKGATVILGDAQDTMEGNFFAPTIITGVTSDMAVATEETFGPLAPLFKFENEDEVIAMANDTIFGLASYFYAKDLSRVYKVAEALEYGIVGINTGIISTELAPFGGVKQSGLGREGSHHGMEDYQEMKYICMSV
ncbi:NAD-dependent succinate-semialdehyde dehydrogenase [Pseudosulfitobacter pseudonitzschiae]|uniref:NAD-dependent succinate-semialdehyde dehydrogenase n=1 Tax=Pseudosulfitobacter pseudonitzschiae TaxID=1402135 RepID=UPI001AF7F28E|nr:NAD-dependent succinate-semialdehyde dehydrogenase [Pseudosulfitobacter pseudonitzschiae]MBM1816387.1 NAD-dependent succinate-semialdehyde dehydrogenase [Pseudosulfitobacter pseudonitzschiae]MBM1832985.1 NAD-dependent succinate-semialdehyde dehydrogenase [Pseudosulfitobacter pseudonitzschiae]MBM1837853.1 NAD-dependent succinate-semialdehyde dehydrogenase [Pseudosulfitobacter pseudonitzschiae]MBM1843114.1 NAD-dependent succinate-semialdehyde dehydrogenase [Pseudosulfitobacter pseudonitzschiae